MPCGSNISCPSTQIQTLMSRDDGGNVTNGTDVLSSLDTTTLGNNWNNLTVVYDDISALYNLSYTTPSVTVASPKVPDVELQLIMVAAVLTTACNLIVLTASKFTSGGKSPTLVFIRSLCVGDALIGVYGIFKVAMYMCVDELLMNFFLAESLFFTASFASGLSLLSLNIDCCVKLAEPLNYSNQMDKKNVITVMVMLWNLSFIAGFLPQMGWQETHGRHHILQFFVFHPWHYLLFFSLILVIIFVLNVIITVYMKKKIFLIQSHRSFLSPNSTKFQKYHTLVITTGIDMILWILCYLPFFIYLAIYCDVCYLNGVQAGERNIVYFIPIFLTKSFISGIVHGYRTAQINAVMKRFSYQFSKMVQNSRKRRRKGVQASNGGSNNYSMRSTDVEQTDLDAGVTQSAALSSDSDHIEVIASQLTLYSTVNSAEGGEKWSEEVTRL